MKIKQTLSPAGAVEPGQEAKRGSPPSDGDVAEKDAYPEAQFVADLEKAKAPLKRLSDEALAEHKAMKAGQNTARP